MIRPVLSIRGAAAAALPALCVLGAAPAAQEAPLALPTVTVSGQREVPPGRVVVRAEDVTAPAADAAELLKRVPGADVNRNGPLSGITQYRGLYGTRMNVVVDGVMPTSGGPNWMDPPLHYAPAALLDRVEAHRGIVPVSVAGETLAGHVSAHTRRGELTDGEDFTLQGDLSVSARSGDDGHGLGALLGVANARHRFHVAGVRERGDDYRFPGGEVHPSEYARDQVLAGYGARLGSQELELEYRRNETGDTGTPSLPMDIRYFDSDLWRGAWRGPAGPVRLEASAYATAVDHEMTNFHLRTPPNPSRRRFSVTSSEGAGYALEGALALGAGTLTVGADGHLADHDADIHDPANPGFFVRNFNAVERDRHGVFGEWRGELAAGWSGELGLRYHRVAADAGAVDGTPARMMAGPRILRDRFNAADRDRTEHNVDWVAKLAYAASPELSLEAGLARKSRAPSYQERYLWLPLEATAGLADGNRYVGDVALDAETSHQLELGLEWRRADAYLAPRAFYYRIDDYIQGVPATDPVVRMVSAANGDPTPLRFANVEAEIYGVDAEAGAALGRRWRLHGVLSVVRGERRDIDDNLYRIAPPNLTLALTHHRPRWSLTAESVLYAGQERVADSNDEQETGGYGLLNLSGRYRTAGGVELSAGVANLLDKAYAPHLNGPNRVADSDVAVGARIPGRGRSLYARVAVRW